MRRPIQVSGSMVLCDDGSLWLLKSSMGATAWERIPGVPQDESPQAEALPDEPEPPQGWHEKMGLYGLDP